MHIFLENVQQKFRILFLETFVTHSMFFIGVQYSRLDPGIRLYSSCSSSVSEHVINTGAAWRCSDIYIGRIAPSENLGQLL